MTGLSDTERDNLAGFLRWVRDSSAWSSPSDITEPSAELCEHVETLLATHEQAAAEAATLAERARLLGVIEVLASDWELSSEWATKRGYPPQDDGLTWAQEHHARKLRGLIAQERAR